jgi:adhesin transport system outer membrane protein
VRASLADGDATLKSAQRNLERLTGLAPRALTLAFGATVLRVPQDRNAAAEIALSHNPELAASHIEIEAAEEDRKAQRGRLLPKLAMELSHATSTNAGGTEGKIRDNRAMLVFSAQLYNGGSNWAQVDAAAARRDELVAKATNVERKLVQELEVAYANLDASAVRFAAVRDELDANTKVVTAFRKQLLGANRQLLDVLDAYQRLYQSRLDMTQALISEAQSQLRVAHLTGTIHQLVPGSAELPARGSPPTLPEAWQPYIPDLAPKGPVPSSVIDPDIQVPGR